MVAKNSDKKKRKLKKIIRIFSIILLLYILFFIYSNLDLSKKREYVYYDNISMFNETIQYNSEIIQGTESIFLPGGEKAVLLLHGGGGTPIELKEMAYFLAGKNISVFVPLLPHQGRTYNDLGEVDDEESYNVSLFYLKTLKNNYNQVYVGGLSTGGSLALKLGENENISGIISLASPITYGINFLGDSTLSLFRIANLITPNLRRIEYGLAKNESVAGVLPSFDRLPVSLLIQGELLKKETKNNLQNIDEPILILQSNWDNRVAPSSARYIFDHVSSKDKTLIYLNNSGHVMTLDYDKQIVFEETANFILKDKEA
jgi:carboxylesterase